MTPSPALVMDRMELLQSVGDAFRKAIADVPEDAVLRLVLLGMEVNLLIGTIEKERP